MMVGFYKLACGSSPNKSILTICASTDNKHTKFYSNLAYQSGQLTPGFEDMARLFGEALNAYRSTNNRLPSEIVILRARRSFDEENWASEVNSLLQALKIHTRNFEFEPRVTYIYYDTEPKETFTYMRAGREENSIAGTVVRKAVTSSSYDFYISCGQSYEYLSRPTYYKVLYCTSLWPEDRLQQFIYSQCFNYMGISGVNRLPAVCRYAKRLAYFVNTLGSDCRIQFDKLTHQLFYL
jgi:aubergine-like protein